MAGLRQPDVELWSGMGVRNDPFALLTLRCEAGQDYKLRFELKASGGRSTS